MSKKKIILPIPPVDFEIIGIINQHTDYSFCAKLNKIFNFNFNLHKVKIENFIKNSDALFFVFFYKDEDNDVDYFLLNNIGIIDKENREIELFKSSEKKVRIIEEYPNIEMFLIIYDEAQNYSIEEIKKEIKNNADSQTINIKSESFKDTTIHWLDYIINIIRHS